MSEQPQDTKTGVEQDSNHPSESEDFDFVEGDEVLVRVRERGDTGNIVGKFESVCRGFYQGPPGPGSESARLEPPWDQMGPILLKPYEAEFEVMG